IGKPLDLLEQIGMRLRDARIYLHHPQIISLFVPEIFNIKATVIKPHVRYNFFTDVYRSLLYTVWNCTRIFVALEALAVAAYHHINYAVYMALPVLHIAFGRKLTALYVLFSEHPVTVYSFEFRR